MWAETHIVLAVPKRLSRAGLPVWAREEGQARPEALLRCVDGAD